jgi:hypothetical protein
MVENLYQIDYSFFPFNSVFLGVRNTKILEDSLGLVIYTINKVNNEIVLRLLIRHQLTS